MTNGEIDPLKFTPTENIIIRNSANVAITKNRIIQIYFFSSLFALSLAAMTLLTGSLYGVLAIALLYIAFTTVEKVLYGRGVLLYKSIIQKLLGRIAALEGGKATEDS